MTEARALRDEVASLLSERGIEAAAREAAAREAAAREAAAREAAAREAAAREAAAREAEWLVEAVTGLDRHEIATAGRLEPRQVERVRELARRRSNGEPLQYLTGVAGFRRLEVAVGPGVLIPRPETETVAEVAMEVLPDGGTLVDVGTGCGAIALAVADERPDARVVGTEMSPDALAWAEKNLAATGLAVELVLCDLLSGLSADLKGLVDVIVSNPPYVASSERDSLPEEVVAFEPHAALFAGPDGLSAIRRIAEAAPDWLAPGGAVVLEIGETQGAGAQALLRGAGYRDVRGACDLAGSDRLVVGRAPA